MLDFEGSTSDPDLPRSQLRTVCNVCAPEMVEVPVEIKNTNDTLVSTGTFKVMLDWSRQNVVVNALQHWGQRSALRRRLRQAFNWVFGSSRPPVGVE